MLKRNARTLLAACLIVACSESSNPNDPGGDDPDAVAQVTVSLAATTLNALGATTQASAQLRNASGGSVTAATTWSSSDASVATVTSAGVVTAVKNGTAVITASAGGRQGTATLTVAQAIASVALAPAAPPTLDALGDTTTLTATARDSRTNPVPNVTFTWTSNAPGVATVASGRVTAVTNGTARITATAPGGANAGLDVTVAQAVASVVITPGANLAYDALGATTDLDAAARDANGNVIGGAGITWATSSGSVATVSAAGVVTSTGNGATRITAASAGRLDTVNVTVAQVANNVLLTCTATPLDSWGDTRQCTGVVRDRLNAMMAGAVTWSSSVPGVATVSSSGLVSAKDNGTTTITASFGLLSDSEAHTVDFKIAFGDLVQGTIETPGPLHEYDITGGGGSRNLVTWIHRSPIGSAGIDPHLFINNGSFARGGVTSGRLDAGAELFAQSSYNNTVATQLVMYGEASTTGGYVMGLVDCRAPFAAFNPNEYNWTALQSSDCAVLNGPSSGSAPNLTNAIVARLNLTAGQNITIEVVKGCSPAAAALGCTGSAGSLDPYLYVFGPNNAQVFFDDDGGTGTDASLALAVPTTGAYTAVITTYGSGQLGQFTFCLFAGCATYGSVPSPGGTPAFALSAPGEPESTGWVSRLNVERAYALLGAMGHLPIGFDPRRLRPDK